MGQTPYFSWRGTVFLGQGECSDFPERSERIYDKVKREESEK
jgi:hypothetical protein